MSTDKVSGLMTVSRLVTLVIIDKLEDPVCGVDVEEDGFFDYSDTTARNSIKTLVDKGFVVSERNINDARKREYYITEEGMKILEKYREFLCNTE